MIDRDIEQINRGNKLDLSKGEADRTGIWYGRLQAIRQTERVEDGVYNWLCLCACLGTREVMGNDLELLRVTHCGCADPTEDYEIEYAPSFKRPSWMTQGQVDLLMLILPGPLGEGMKIKEAAQTLGVSEDAARMKLKRFKLRFPEAWDRIESMRNTMMTHRKASREGKIDGIKSFDSLLRLHGEGTLYEMIKGQF